MAYPDEIEAEDTQDLQKELLEEQLEQMEGYPSPKKPDNLFTLFRTVLKTPDSSKVANLDKRELGDLNISVRDCQRIALLAETMRHEKFAEFFMGQGEIVLSTSASKKGWFTELFVTSKKFAAKQVGNLPQQQPKKKWSLYGSANKETTTEEA